MKKVFLIILAVVSLLFSNNVFANNNENKNEISDEKIQEKIEENNKKIRQNIEEEIEKKLNFFEISEEYKNLDEKSKIIFYEGQLKSMKTKLEQTKKEKEIEVCEIFITKINKRLQNLYGESFEDEKIILEILSIN